MSEHFTLQYKWLYSHTPTQIELLQQELGLTPVFLVTDYYRHTTSYKGMEQKTQLKKVGWVINTLFCSAAIHTT